MFWIVPPLLSREVDATVPVTCSPPLAPVVSRKMPLAPPLAETDRKFRLPAPMVVFCTLMAGDPAEPAAEMVIPPLVQARLLEPPAMNTPLAEALAVILTVPMDVVPVTPAPTLMPAVLTAVMFNP